MLKQTKILVVSRKKLLPGIIVISCIVVLIEFLCFFKGCFAGKDKDTKPTVVESPIALSEDEHIYNPGIYTSSVLLNGNVCDIQVTVDFNTIKDVKLVNQSDAVKTSYPGLSLTFDEIRQKIKSTGDTCIDYDASNRYTYSLFIDAIENAIEKSY